MNKLSLLVACTAILLLCEEKVWSQPITYTASFTKKIEKVGIDVYKPVEKWMHVYPLDSDEFMHYDLVLQNDINDFEVRYRIRPDNKHWRKVPNAIELQRLIASVATNDQSSDIHVSIPDSTFATQNFNAETAFIGEFIPKIGFSEKQYGAMISLYKTGHGSVDVIVLHNDPNYDVLKEYRQLWFN